MIIFLNPKAALTFRMGLSVAKEEPDVQEWVVVSPSAQLECAEQPLCARD